jgi:hypothetical protein
MRRLLQRDPAATPAPQPPARPEAAAPSSPQQGQNANRGESATTSGRRNQRSAPRGAAAAETAAVERPESARANNRRQPRPTPDPNEALVRSANEATTVVARFLQHANDGKYSQARNLLTAETQRYFDSEFSAIHGDLMTVLDRITRDGQLSMIRYPLANVRGEGISVTADMQYRDGVRLEQRFRVIQVGQNYRIALDVSNPEVTKAQSADAPVSSAPAQRIGRPENRQPLVSSTSEDVLTGSGVVTRPEVPSAPPAAAKPRPTPPPPAPTPETTTDAQTTTPSPTQPEQPSLEDKPWPTAPANQQGASR